MGAWGVGPFDNDDAAGMIAELSKHIDKVNRGSSNPSRGKRHHYGAARAAAQFLLLSHGTDILGGPGLEPAARALARMRMDSGWLANWNNPKKIAAALDRELLAVSARMARCKGCRQIGKPERRALAALIEEALRCSVPSKRSKRLPPRTTRAVVRKLVRTKAPASQR